MQGSLAVTLEAQPAAGLEHDESAEANHDYQSKNQASANMGDWLLGIGLSATMRATHLGLLCKFTGTWNSQIVKLISG